MKTWINPTIITSIRTDELKENILFQIDKNLFQIDKAFLPQIKNQFALAYAEMQLA